MYISIGLCSSIAMRMMLSSENARRERGDRDEVITGNDIERIGGEGMARSGKNGVYENVDIARANKGDEWSGFRYSL